MLPMLGLPLYDLMKDFGRAIRPDPVPEGRERYASLPATEERMEMEGLVRDGGGGGGGDWWIVEVDVRVEVVALSVFMGGEEGEWRGRLLESRSLGESLGVGKSLDRFMWCRISGDGRLGPRVDVEVVVLMLLMLWRSADRDSLDEISNEVRVGVRRLLAGLAELREVDEAVASKKGTVGLSGRGRLAVCRRGGINL